MSKIVAIVGRPNVGKSTLFNRLTGSREAIVDEQSGVTRDRHYGSVEWNGKTFTIIDTGGYVKGSDDVFEESIRNQVNIAINEADILLFVVDVTVGITDLDNEVVKLLRQTNKQIFLVANKVDNNKRIADAAEFYSFGLTDKIYNISSINGSGTGELLDDITNLIPEEETQGQTLDLPRIAIVGRPNVGKSSLLNTLIGKEQNIVTPIAGTTRDAIETRYNAYGFDFILVDTAGLRKKAKVHEDVEFYSVMRTIRALENCDVCLLMIEADKGMGAQDMNIFHLAVKNKKGIVILVNKWDLVDKETKTAKLFEEEIRNKIAPFKDVPIIFTSVINKQRIHKALEKAIEVYNNRNKKIKTHKLNEIMLEEIKNYPPPANKGKWIKIKFITQLPSKTPSFAFFCNLPQYVKEPYKRFLENKIREHFNFEGVPIQIFMRKK